MLNGSCLKAFFVLFASVKTAGQSDGFPSIVITVEKKAWSPGRGALLADVFKSLPAFEPGWSPRNHCGFAWSQGEIGRACLWPTFAVCAKVLAEMKRQLNKISIKEILILLA